MRVVLKKFIICKGFSRLGATNYEQLFKRLKAVGNVVLPPCVQAKIDVCKVTEIYQNEARNKPAISMTVRRAHFEDENKAPDWPGQS